jgi:hypothetical protein
MSLPPLPAGCRPTARPRDVSSPSRGVGSSPEGPSGWGSDAAQPSAPGSIRTNEGTVEVGRQSPRRCSTTDDELGRLARAPRSRPGLPILNLIPVLRRDRRERRALPLCLDRPRIRSRSARLRARDRARVSASSTGLEHDHGTSSGRRAACALFDRLRGYVTDLRSHSFADAARRRLLDARNAEAPLRSLLRVLKRAWARPVVMDHPTPGARWRFVDEAGVTSTRACCSKGRERSARRVASASREACRRRAGAVSRGARDGSTRLVWLGTYGAEQAPEHIHRRRDQLARWLLVSACS